MKWFIRCSLCTLNCRSLDRMKTLAAFFFGGICLLLAACQDRENIRDYYFPLDALQQPRVYEYRPVNNDSLPPLFWKYQATKRDSGTFFAGKLYDLYTLPSQEVEEQAVSNGVRVRQLVRYRFDSTGTGIKIPVHIKVGDIFPFKVKDSSFVYVYNVSFTDPVDTLQKVTLIRNRCYKGHTQFIYQGKSMDCVAFDLKEEQDVEKDGHLVLHYVGRELYAKGIGLVYFDRYYEGRKLAVYQLVNTYPWEEFEKRLK